MSVRELCRVLRSHWHDFAHYFWPESPDQQWQAELDQLAEDLRRRYLRLVRKRCKIEQLRHRLAQQERHLVRLGDHLQTDPAHAVANQTAQALERCRRAAERTRGHLLQHEQMYERQRLAFERRKRRRVELQLAGSAVFARPQDQESQVDF
jgi:hypothetical protein